MKRFLLLMLAFWACLPASARTDCFTVKRHRLLDATGTPFVIRGMNNPHAWFSEKAFRALDRIHQVGCNTVRVVWQTNRDDAELERIIRRCIELEMIPMVELHDVTGKPSRERLVDMARWYAEPGRAAMLQKYEQYLLLNIANEWGDHTITTAYWLDAYTEAVGVMREAGYRLPLVVDAPGWGQNITPFIEGGRRLIVADPLHNILLSVHMYGSWNDPEKIRADLATCRKLRLPVIVGEFGYNSNDGKNNLGCKADHTVILETCNRLAYGYMPWSWTGNNQENQWLDLVESSDWETLTWWGRQVIAGPGGITETARSAAVFRKDKH